MHDLVCYGAIIAGGQSQRMGKTDKVWLELNGVPLVLGAANRLSKQTDKVIININTTSNDYDYPVVPDDPYENLGPLGGIAACLEWIKQQDSSATHMISAAADAPFFPSDLLQQLLNDYEQNTIIVPYYNNFSQQLFTLWPMSCLAELKTHLQSNNNMKVMVFIKSQQWKKVEVKQQSADPFFNINTPDDWKTARTRKT